MGPLKVRYAGSPRKPHPAQVFQGCPPASFRFPLVLWVGIEGESSFRTTYPGILPGHGDVLKIASVFDIGAVIVANLYGLMFAYRK